MHDGSQPSSREFPLHLLKLLVMFACRYSPANIVLAAAGRIDFDDLVATAEKVCGGWGRIAADREISRPSTKAGFEVIAKPSATQEYLLEMCDAPSATDDDRYAAKLLTTMLGDDSGSRLYWELVDPGLAEHASLHHYEYMGAGAFLTYLSCDPEFAADNLKRVLKVYRQAEMETLRPPSWPKPRARSIPASCWGASGLEAGCLPLGQIGRIGGRIAAWPTIWRRSTR